MACIVAMACAMLPGQTYAQAGDAIGDAAQRLLALQASNAAAAPAQPMLGVEAGAAWKRYMKSFDTAIPTHYGSSFEDVGRPPDANQHDAD